MVICLKNTYSWLFYNKEAEHPDYYLDVLIAIQQQDFKGLFYIVDVHGIHGDITNQTVIALYL